MQADPCPEATVPDGLRCSTTRLEIEPCDETAAALLARVVDDPLVQDSIQGAGRAVRSRARPLSLKSGADGWTVAGQLNLAVRVRDREPIGLVQLSGRQLGYFVAPNHWNQGYGFEMVEAVCRLYPRRLGLDALRAAVFRENVASRRILERLGFTFGGLIRTAGPLGRAALRYELAVARQLKPLPGFTVHTGRRPDA